MATAALAALALAVGTPLARAAAPLAWSTRAAVDASSPPGSISCPTDGLCVAVDPAGRALAGTGPETAAPSWVATTIAGHPLTAVSCAGLSLCVAVDAAGGAHLSTAPAEGTWSSASIDPGHSLAGVSCPDSSLCVAVDDAGQVLRASFPGGWSAPAKVDSQPLRAVSCATAGMCAAVDAGGSVLASTDRGVSWQARPLSRGVSLQSISCPQATLCAALGGEGEAFASADPWAVPPAAPTWSATQLGLGGTPAVSCASSGLCVAVDGGEAALASDDAAAPVPQWSESRAPGADLRALSCLPSGACVAFDASGRPVVGRVPEPLPVTAAPAEVAPFTALLAGTVDPEDAALTGCWFEYGPTAAYGAIAPCASAPAPGSAPVPVTAALGALSPNTVYHYRLLAASAIARAASPDATFTTSAVPGAPLLYPHPSIHGTPAVGQHLSCSPGVTGASSLVYAWYRDLVAIPFATSSTYLVRGTDSGHHLQCAVTASDAGGDATARSSFVTIPAGGAPAAAGETSVGSPRLRGRNLLVPVACSPRASHGCNVSLRLTAVVTLNGRRVVGVSASSRRTLVLAHARAFIGRGAQRTVALALSATARRLLAARHRIPALLTASGTVIGVIEAPLSRQPVMLASGSRSASGHGHGARR